jgi:hypothetical protein
MFQEYQNFNFFPITAADVLGNLLAALICGILLAIIYRFTYRGPSYSVTFVNAIVLLTVISALIILVIGNNLARAFGLVGAMSIIRFRTAIRDTMDMVFIFIALGIGMACGVGLKLVAFLGVIVVGLIIISMTLTQFGQIRRRYHLLYFTYLPDLKTDNFIEKVLQGFSRKFKLVTIKSNGMGGEVDAFYHVSLKNQDKASEFVSQIRKVESVRSVQLYFDEDDLNSPNN